MTEQSRYVLTPTAEAISRRFDQLFVPAYATDTIQVYKADGFHYSDFPGLVNPIAMTAREIQGLFQDEGQLVIVVFPEKDYLRILGLSPEKKWISSCTRSSSGEGKQFELNDLFCLAPYHGEGRAAPSDWGAEEVKNLYIVYDGHEWTHIVLDRVMPHVFKKNYDAIHEAMAEIAPKILLGGLATLPEEARSFLLSLPTEAMVSWLDINKQGPFAFDGSIPHLNRAYASCLLGGMTILDILGDGDYRVGFNNLLAFMKRKESQGENSQFVSGILRILSQREFSFSDKGMVRYGQEVLRKKVA